MPFTDYTLKGKCLAALDFRDQGDPRYFTLLLTVAQRLGVHPQQVEVEISRLAHSAT